MAINYSTIEIRNRFTRTLMRMWWQLNGFGWPKEFGPKQELTHDETSELMERIVAEVGKRAILANPGPREAARKLVHPRPSERRARDVAAAGRGKTGATT